MLSRACPGWFKRGPATAQKRPQSGSDAPLFESNAAAARPVRLSVFSGLEIGLHWFTNPFKASRPPVPPPPPPLPGGLFVGLLYRSSTTVILWHCCIPLHKQDTRLGYLRTALACASARPLAHCNILLHVLTESNTSQT